MEEIQSPSKAQQENEAAQIAAMEAISIGRETASSLSQQGESLKKSESMMKDQKYILDKSKRVLRGMTWSGWVTNLMTPDVQKPSGDTTYLGTAEIRSPNVKLIENVEALSPELRPAAQAMNNFLCNIQMLNVCKDPDQFKNIIQICNHLQQLAAQEWDSLESQSFSNFKTSHLHKQLGDEFIRIHQYYNHIKNDKHNYIRKTQLGVPLSGTSISKPLPHPSTTPTTQLQRNSPQTSKLEQEQDAHLDVISMSLGELKSMGSSINESIEQQNSTMDFIQSQSESLSQQTRMLIRKADRLTKWKIFDKPIFQSFQAIIYIPTNTYLSVKDNVLHLSPQFLGDASTFAIWKSSSKRAMIGFQNKQNDKWLGQSTFFKSIVCTSSSFGRSEEWEMEDEAHPEKTALVCASANWGNGGWFVFDNQTNAGKIHDIDSHNKPNSMVWSVVDVPV